MNLFRRLDAASDPMATALVADRSRTAETPASHNTWTPAPEHPEIWAAFTAIGNSDGVIDHTATSNLLADPRDEPDNP